MIIHSSPLSNSTRTPYFTRSKTHRLSSSASFVFSFTLSQSRSSSSPSLFSGHRSPAYIPCPLPPFTGRTNPFLLIYRAPQQTHHDCSIVHLRISIAVRITTSNHVFAVPKLNISIHIYSCHLIKTKLGKNPSSAVEPSFIHFFLFFLILHLLALTPFSIHHNHNFGEMLPS